MATTPKYAFLMVEYDKPSFIEDLQRDIPESELFTSDEPYNHYGIADECHVTLVPCLDNDVNQDELIELAGDIRDYKALLTNVSIFENDEYDVLKCDAESKFLSDANKRITDRFETHSQYKDYHPHMTIAYLKKGLADKYKKDVLPALKVVEPKRFILSWYEDGKERKRYFGGKH